MISVSGAYLRVSHRAVLEGKGRVDLEHHVLPKDLVHYIGEEGQHATPVHQKEVVVVVGRLLDRQVAWSAGQYFRVVVDDLVHPHPWQSQESTVDLESLDQRCVALQVA